MEIDADNLKQLGFELWIDQAEGSLYYFTTGDHIIFVTVYPSQCAEVKLNALPVPHAKTIEHIQQLINLFIDPPKVENIGEPLLEKHYVSYF